MRQFGELEAVIMDRLWDRGKPALVREVLDDLRSGVLVCMLSEFPAPSIPLSLVYPSRRHLAPRTRVVFEFILEQARQIQSMLATVTNKARTA